MGGYNSLIPPLGWFGFVRFLAADSLRRQYARTRLGPMWIVVTQFVTIFGIGLVFFTIFDRPFDDFLPFISAGIVGWNLIAPPITSAAAVFVANGPLIQSFRMPPAIFPLQTTINALVVFLHGLAVHLLIMVIVGKPLTYLPVLLVSIPLVLAAIYPVVAVLGLVGARLRDTGPLLASVMYMAFLVTPIIWEPGSISDRIGWIVELNPFYHLIEIIRRPMLGEFPALLHWAVSLGIAIVSAATGSYLFRKYSRPLPFWV